MEITLHSLILASFIWCFDVCHLRPCPVCICLTGHEVAKDFKSFMTDLQVRLQRTRDNYTATQNEAESLMLRMLEQRKTVSDQAFHLALSLSLFFCFSSIGVFICVFIYFFCFLSSCLLALCTGNPFGWFWSVLVGFLFFFFCCVNG